MHDYYTIIITDCKYDMHVTDTRIINIECIYLNGCL